MSVLSKIQVIGKALMLPIAVLPVAGLLLRFGQPDLFDISVLRGAGDGVFANLPLLFAIGVAVGLAKKNEGSAALAGAVSFLMLTSSLAAYKGTLQDTTLAYRLDVFGGIMAGLIAGWANNKFSSVRLPDFLGFFGGRRLVPIVSGVITVALVYIVILVWPAFEFALSELNNFIVSAGSLGLFLYGFANRLLIITGLHHILNTFFWFQFGEFAQNGAVVQGDINRYFAGDPSAGYFMAGFFPIMMFALPAAGLAMALAAKKERRAEVFGIMSSLALTSFLTGITEPIEYAFMLVAPVLYLFHALSTGIALAITGLLQVRNGFTFSAGAIDFFLNAGLGSNVWIIPVMGIVFALIYFLFFYFTIIALKIPTIGREETNDTQSKLDASSVDEIATAYLKALGGKENLTSIDACVTRLRLQIKSIDRISESDLKNLGAKGILKLGGNGLQVIIGTQAEVIAERLKTL